MTKYVKVLKKGKCKAITLKGKRCNHSVWIDGYCQIHHYVVWHEQKFGVKK